MAGHLLQGKYLPLYEYLSKQQERHIVLTFEEIEEILQAKLPKSAYKYQAWWGNTRSGTYVQAAAWLEAGYRVDIVQFGRCVEFLKVSKEILTKKKNKVMRGTLISKSIPDTTYNDIESFQKIMEKMDAAQQFFTENNHRRFTDETIVSQFKVFCEWRRLFGRIEQDVNYLAKQLMYEFLLEKHRLAPNSSFIKQQDEYTFLYEEKTTTGDKIAAILKTAPPSLTADFAPGQRSRLLQDCRLLNYTNAIIQYYFVTEEPAFNVIEKNYKQHLGNIQLILLPKVIADKYSLHA
ncbi:hypothetical protein [Rummeliibacillus pycnus]|uniref:DUF7662 domain-containing protein n=1 Tax=Rummeliibacillus pycnus TaxID=101070 RepID=UPI0037CB37BA